MTITVSQKHPKEMETEEPTKERILSDLKRTSLNDFTAVVNQREEALMRAIVSIRQNSKPLHAHYQLYPFPFNGTQAHSPDFIISNAKVHGKFLSLDPHSFPFFEAFKLQALADVLKWKSFKDAWGKRFFIVLATDQDALRSMLNVFNMNPQKIADAVWDVRTLEVSDTNIAAQTEHFRFELINLLRRPEVSISQKDDEAGLAECITEAQRLRPVPEPKSEDKRTRERLARVLWKEAQANNIKVSFHK